jgi:hypothetical protein
MIPGPTPSKDWSTAALWLPFVMPLHATLSLILLLFPVAARCQWVPEKPLHAERTGTFQESRLTESSGVAVSRDNPGLLYTFNDSGNDPIIFITDLEGRAIAAIAVPGAKNEDWEAIALGPCGTTWCLYIGDTGDNHEHRRHAFIYRVPEPVRTGGVYTAYPTGFQAERLKIHYPDGPHDIEALLVTPRGNLILLTKGRSGPIQEFRVSAAAWTTDTSVTAESLGALPITPDRNLGRWVTDAALAPNGRDVVVRTYRELYFFTLDQSDGLTPGAPPRRCDLGDLEVQGEGVAWLDDRRLVLTSERAFLPAGTIHVVQCQY